jgi:hypothetical protein
MTTDTYTHIHQLIATGQKEAAIQLIQEFIRQNAEREILWLRLSVLVKGKQRLDCLEKALTINPNNKQTLRLIERLNPKRAIRLRKRLRIPW